MSKPIAVPARPGPSHTSMLASADDALRSQPVSPCPARCEVSWSQSRSREPDGGHRCGLTTVRFSSKERLSAGVRLEEAAEKVWLPAACLPALSSICWDDRVMQGFERPDAGLWDVSALVGHLMPESGMFAFLARHRGEVFRTATGRTCSRTGAGRASR